MNIIEGKGEKRMIEEKDKPRCQLSGEDGNVFAIIGRVSKVLERNGQKDEASEFRAKAMQQKSYGAVLQLCHEYVDVQ